MQILKKKQVKSLKAKIFNFVSKQLLNKDHAMYACKKLSKTLTFLQNGISSDQGMGPLGQVKNRKKTTNFQIH